MNARVPLGDSVLVLAVLAWVSASVGPWWVGLSIFCGAWALNMLERAK